MAPLPRVTQQINESFPKPSVCPVWLDECLNWLIDDQHVNPVTSFPEFVHKVKSQLLQSDLRDSMMHGTGLDVHIDRFTGNLRGPPVLVQITAITEIGISAFQLEQVRAAREERLTSGIGDEEAEEDGDVDVEGEGPMPKYPRATLRFQLSDGVTTLEAMEYRPLPQLSLGPTPLGYKLQLKGTRIQNGMAFLEPATVILLGGAAEFEERQREEFKQGLRERLGLPREAEPEAPAPAAALPPPVVEARSPLRDISPPPSPPLFPQHDDDIDMGARRRRVPTSSSTASSSRNVSDNIQERPIIGLPRGRKSNTSTTTNNKHISESEEPVEVDRERRPSAAQRNTLTYAAASQNDTTSSHHFNKTNRKRDPDDVNMDVENIDFNFSPTTRQLARTYRPSPSTSVDIPLRVQLQQRQNDRSFDFDLLDEIDQDENQPPPLKQRQPSSSAAAAAPPPPSRDLKGKGRLEPFSPFFVDQSRKRSFSLSKIDDASSDDYGMMGIDDNDFADAEFLEKLDRVEMEALLGGGDANGSSHVATAGGVGLLPSSSGTIGGSSGSVSGLASSYVLVDGDKQISSSVSAPIASASSSSSTKPTRPMEIIEIDSDEDDEMLGTDDKENEPVATRHVRRRTGDQDEGLRERGGGLFASQGWNPLPSGVDGGGGRRGGGLGSQSQNRSQNRSQGLKSRAVLTTSPKDVIDLSDSDDD